MDIDKKIHFTNLALTYSSLLQLKMGFDAIVANFCNAAWTQLQKPVSELCGRVHMQRLIWACKLLTAVLCVPLKLRLSTHLDL
jgi:hypothetical protein